MRIVRWAVVGVALLMVASLVALGLSVVLGQADKIDRLNSGYSTLYTQVQDLGGTPDVSAPQNGTKGDQGEPGRDGRDGSNGVNGRDGASSTVAGPAGATGANGLDSTVPGPAGEQGPAGPQGDPGTNGTNGVDGQSAFPFFFTFELNGQTVTCNLLSAAMVGDCVTQGA